MFVSEPACRDALLGHYGSVLVVDAEEYWMRIRMVTRRSRVAGVVGVGAAGVLAVTSGGIASALVGSPEDPVVVKDMPVCGNLVNAYVDPFASGPGAAPARVSWWIGLPDSRTVKIENLSSRGSDDKTYPLYADHDGSSESSPVAVSNGDELAGRVILGANVPYGVSIDVTFTLKWDGGSQDFSLRGGMTSICDKISVVPTEDCYTKVEVTNPWDQSPFAYRISGVPGAGADGTGVVQERQMIAFDSIGMFKVTTTDFVVERAVFNKSTGNFEWIKLQTASQKLVSSSACPASA